MKRSTLALLGSLMGLMYLICLTLSLIWVENPAALSFQLGTLTVKMAWMLPCAVLTAAAALFQWIHWLAKKRYAALVSALFYAAAAPMLTQLFAVPLALALIALAGFLWSAPKEKKAKKKNAPVDPAPDTLPDAAEEPDGLGDLDDLDGLDEPEEAEDEDEPEEAEDEPDLALDDDAGDDLSLDPEEDEKEEPLRPRADGMAVFLGIFMGTVALALIGMVVYGLMGGKLPFMQ